MDCNFSSTPDMAEDMRTTPNSYALYVQLKQQENRPDGDKPKKKKKAKRKARKKQEKVADLALHYERALTSPPSHRDLGYVPDYMKLTMHQDSGVFFGQPQYSTWQCEYVGKPQNRDGHILIVGGPGSGKSSSIAVPCLSCWQGPIVALDVKGELGNHHQHLMSAKRPAKIFAPDSPQGTSTYDPLYSVRQHGEEDLFANVYALAQTIIPPFSDSKDNFWRMGALKLLMASFHHHLNMDLDFNGILKSTTSRSITELIKEMHTSTNAHARRLVASFVRDDLSDSEMLMDMVEHMMISIMEFVSDQRIQNAMTPSADTIQWDRHLHTHNIFLSIPEYKLDQWGSMVTLLLTQLVRSLERRPEKHSPEGQKLPPVLLLLDEFPRIGKMEVIANALATLRSKNVTICMYVQSLAQLDHIYGPEIRRIILDTCDYKAILGVNDYDSQLYFSNLTGNSKIWNRGFGETFNPASGELGYSRNLSETWEPIIQPHEFALLDKELILLHPNGFCKLNKAPRFSSNRLPSN